MCAYFILHKTAFIEKRNRLRCVELGRSIVINKGEDMKMISHHFGRFADFKYIAVIPSLGIAQS